MKKLIATAASALLIASSLAASVDVSAGYNTDYYFRGMQLADDFVDASIDYAEGDFYAGVWAALPLDDDFVKEVDFYAGYGTTLTEGISVDIGLTSYVYEEGKATWEPYIGFSFDDLPVAPSIKFFYDLSLELFTVEGGIGYTVEIDDVSSIDLSANLGYMSDDSTDVTYYLLTAAYTYAMSETSSLSASINYTDGDNVIRWDNGFYATIGASFSF